MTTNIELIELANHLDIRNFHCVCKDKIKNIEYKLPCSIIVNLDDSNNNGVVKSRASSVPHAGKRIHWPPRGLKCIVEI